MNKSAMAVERINANFAKYCTLNILKRNSIQMWSFYIRFDKFSLFCIYLGHPAYFEKAVKVGVVIWPLIH